MFFQKIKKGRTTLGIIFLGLGLRVIAINQSFWLDEAVQAWLSSHFSLKDLFTIYMPGDFNPPLYHLITWLWAKPFGTSEISMRTLPLIFSLISIWLTIKASQIVKKGTGHLAGLLLATAPLHIYYSQENRMYMLACLGVILSFYNFLKLSEQPSWKETVAFGLSLTVAGFSHFLTLFTFPVFLIFGFKKINFKKLAVAFLLPTIGYVIYLPLFLKQLKQGLRWSENFPVWSQTVGSFTLKALGLLPIKMIIGRISFNNKVIYGIVATSLVFFFGIIILRQTIKAIKQKNYLRQLLLALLLLPPAIGFLISFRVPVFSYFRFLYLLPFFYITIAIFTTENQKRTKILLPIIITINLVFSLTYLLNRRFHREDWRGLTQWINRNNTDNCPAIILGQIATPLEYYDKDQTRKILVWPPGLLPKEKIEREDCLFLINYGLSIFDPEGQIEQTLNSGNFLEEDTKHFNLIFLTKYKNQKQDEARPS